MTESVVERIRAFNEGRERERLALKYRAMRESPFRFFRGTCHLFYEDWPRDSALNNAPLAWICGDLHLENFGSFRGDNRLVYFDLNDFDEAVLAPATWEIARFLTSALLAARQAELGPAVATELCGRFLTRYRDSLRDGKARWVERSTSRGMVSALLRDAKRRTQAQLLKSRTRLIGGRRRLRLDRRRALPLSPSERTTLLRRLRELGKDRTNPRFYRVHDVARRIAGTGSLGVRRFVVVVQGDRASGGEVLLDLKEAQSSALSPYLATPQPEWKSPAHRVVSIQRWVQAASPAFLHAVMLDGIPYVLRELQPTEDRLDLNAWNGKLRRLERVMETMGDVVAWGQLRSGGRLGSATTDAWMAFAGQAAWGKAVLDYARSYARAAIRDWEIFRKAGEIQRISESVPSSTRS